MADITLTLVPGAVLAVIGPNGAGKSTLLRLLAGELRPSRGNITLDSVPLSAMAPLALARRRAVVAQSAALAFPMRVQEVVGLGRLPWHGSRAAVRDDAATGAALHRVGIAHLARRQYQTLSGGERQRVQLARAFAQLDGAARPAALLLDEPTASLDVAHAAALLRALRALAAEGIAVLAVMHDLNEAHFVADRVLVLSEGRPVALGPPEEALAPTLLAPVYGLPFQALPDGGLLPEYGAIPGRGFAPPGPTPPGG
nr:heme ABC transporter ATP-binding protein [Plastoroseomonas hellenica]